MTSKHRLPRRIIILGPQGSGKGTQAELLGRRLRLPVGSMGELLRREIARRTVIGDKVKRYLDRGRLVPPHYGDRIFLRWIKRGPARRGFIMDGYPRSLAQMRFVNQATPIDVVVAFELSDHDAVERLKGRLVSLGCGAVYHAVHRPPRKHLRCHVCGDELVRRHDDTPSAVRTRLRLYHRETEPVIRAYDRRGLVLHIDARPRIPVIARRLGRLLRRPLVLRPRQFST